MKYLLHEKKGSKILKSKADKEKKRREVEREREREVANRHKDTACKGDFRNGTKLEIFFKTSSQCDQSDCLLCSATEVGPIRVFVLI